MKTTVEEMIDDARADARRLLDTATEYDRAADAAEIDGNGDPEYLRASARALREDANSLIDKARALAN